MLFLLAEPRDCPRPHDFLLVYFHLSIYPISCRDGGSETQLLDSSARPIHFSAISIVLSVEYLLVFCLLTCADLCGSIFHLAWTRIVQVPEYIYVPSRAL